MARYFLLFFVLSFAACNQGQQESPPNTKSAPVFEIREFKIERSATEYAWTYNGRGTVITKDPEIQSITVLLWLKQEKEGAPSNADDTYKLILVSNGVGTIETSEYYSKKTKYLQDGYSTDPGHPKYRWHVLGYSKLSEATLQTEK